MQPQRLATVLDDETQAPFWWKGKGSQNTTVELVSKNKSKLDQQKTNLIRRQLIYWSPPGSFTVKKKQFFLLCIYFFLLSVKQQLKFYKVTKQIWCHRPIMNFYRTVVEIAAKWRAWKPEDTDWFLHKDLEFDGYWSFAKTHKSSEVLVSEIRCW